MKITTATRFNTLPPRRAARAAPTGTPHQQRVRAELEQLSGRIERLDNFAGSRAFDLVDEREQDLLSLQRDAMGNYREALRARVELHELNEEARADKAGPGSSKSPIGDSTDDD